jgi:hypothetical protein
MGSVQKGNAMTRILLAIALGALATRLLAQVPMEQLAKPHPARGSGQSPRVTVPHVMGSGNRTLQSPRRSPRKTGPGANRKDRANGFRSAGLPQCEALRQ